MIMKIRDYNYKKYGVAVMGIINATPDSFSDGGSYATSDDAVTRALIMEEEGAVIADIGGESTRPGYTPVDEEEELKRVIPVIEGIRKKSDIIISVDTVKPAVARRALEAGADIINDISCLKEDGMAELIADTGCGYVLMHNRYEAYNDFYDDYMSDIKTALDKLIKAGVSKEKIILDPGVGFAKDYEQNLIVTKHIGDLKELGYDVLLGVSRKSVVGKCLDLPVDERLEGTLALGSYGVLNGADILRVHDVKEHVRMVKMLTALRNVE